MAAFTFTHENWDGWGRRSRLAVLSRRMAWFSLLVLLISGLAHRQAMLETPAFVATLGAAAVFASAALGLAALALVRIWHNGDRGGSDAIKAMLVAGIVLLPFAASGARAVTLPPISDISTDPETPPTLGAEDEGEAFTPEHRQFQVEAYPELAGRRYPVPLERAVQAVQTLFSANGWEQGEPAVGPGEATLRATAYTRILGFSSDVAVRIADEGETSFVDMRSRSRFGDHDLGDNAARIKGFLAELDRATAVRANAPAAPSE